MFVISSFVIFSASSLSFLVLNRNSIAGWMDQSPDQIAKIRQKLNSVVRHSGPITTIESGEID